MSARETKLAFERRPTSRQLASAALEERFFALRAQGKSATEAGMLLGLTTPASDRLGGLYAAQYGPGRAAVDPTAARHDDHVAAVLAQGGFVRFERLRGRIVQVRP